MGEGSREAGCRAALRECRASATHRSERKEARPTVDVRFHVDVAEQLAILIVRLERLVVLVPHSIVNVGCEVSIVAKVDLLRLEVVGNCGKSKSVSKKEGRRQVDAPSILPPLSFFSISASIASSSTSGAFDGRPPLPFRAALATRSFLSLTAFGPNFFSSCLHRLTISF